ncbi:hypothetical protein [Arthrobacter glacialis]|uniref:hypothetical protein n=1 Tax=Arthrobacter glacialis TaxID=1664 RepID=UPI000CD4246D|nr:hypothetical protein [Arthrobacter glacialis]POH58890.1 hypothetical protein CVS28_09280 [Arthrobacter glacialis]
MDTPVSKSLPTGAFTPVNIFFRGLDYKFKQDRSVTPPTPARVAIVRARQEQVSELRHLVAKFQRTIQSVIDADQYGVAEGPADLLVSMGEDITAKSQQLYRDIHAAKARFHNVPSVSEVAPEPPAADVPPASAAGASSTNPKLATAADGSILPASMVIMPKPSAINFPATMSQALGMRAAAGRGVL